MIWGVEVTLMFVLLPRFVILRCLDFFIDNRGKVASIKYVIIVHLFLFMLQGEKDYLRNHLLPNPRTYVSSKGYSFPKKTGE